MKHKLLLITLFISLIGTQKLVSQTHLSVLANKPGPEIQPTMWGIFFEDINFAADGGLYAELVKNRSFEFPDPMMGWKTPSKDSIQILNNSTAKVNHRFIRMGNLPSGKPNYLQNQGFRGIGITSNEKYRLNLMARSANPADIKLKAELLSASGQPIGQAPITLTTKNWNNYEAIIPASATDAKANLRISLEGKGTVDLDMISLFPVNTFKNRPNGMRADLAQLLADLKPGFIRFPGGCVVEGHHLDLRYQWKKTVGPIDERELIINRWNTEFMYRHTPDYFQSYGLGFFEYFVLAEDLGAEPLPIINCGMACQYNTSELVQLDELGPYIQDALDLIEFANGEVSTRWGKLRAEMGHAAPFNLKFLGIGNEQWGQQYLDRYEIIAKAIRAKYPDMKLVSGAGPSPDGDKFEYLWKKLKTMDATLVDEHYYKDPDWFFNNAKRYDNYDRNAPKVFAGEYASHKKDKGAEGIVNNHWLSALSEAAFMTGLERNADVVQMASYAPLFAHTEAWQWNPDLIWFDNLTAVATPNYYVQQMYSTHRGTHVLPVMANNAPVTGQDSLFSSASTDKITGKIYLKIVNSSAKRKSTQIDFPGTKIKLPQAEITELYASDLTVYNSLENKTRIVPQTRKAPVKGNKLTIELQPRSFTLIELSTK